MNRTFGALSRAIRISDGVRLRREHFGGIVFDRRTGTTLDVDRRVFRVLERMQGQGVLREDALARALCGRKTSEHQLAKAHKIVNQLLDLAILGPASVADVHSSATRRTADSELPNPADDCWPRGPHLTAPVTAHWAVTYKCRSSCPECYARRYSREFPDELTLSKAQRLVTILAEWGVFELSIGGGEPLGFPPLPAIAREAKRQGLVVHVTTGQHCVSAGQLDELADGITGFQIGVKADHLLASTSTETASLAQTARLATERGLQVGANLILSKQTLPHFERLLEILRQAGLSRLTLLRYKPPADVAEWQRAKPSVKALREFEQRLPEIVRRYPEMDLRLDCALSFLQRHLVPAEALAQGVRGCVAGDRILAITPDGSVFPCSQLVHPRFCSGNLLGDSLDELWATSKIMRRYRLFRDKTKFAATTCGLCAAKGHCGGCRAFAHDGWGADPECPGPLVPPINQLGKLGRKWDIDRYLRLHHSISVREYMQRYGVGQKRAISELRNFGCFMESGTGRRQSDVYVTRTEDLIGEIQDMIGSTSGGVPFATREEVARWIGQEDVESFGNYPRWLLGQRYDDGGASRIGRRQEKNERKSG